MCDTGARGAGEEKAKGCVEWSDGRELTGRATTQLGSGGAQACSLALEALVGVYYPTASTPAPAIAARRLCPNRDLIALPLIGTTLDQKLPQRG